MSTSVRTSFYRIKDFIYSNTLFDPTCPFRLVFITQIIKTQTVYFIVDNVRQKCFQRDALSVVHNAFKYRILHPSSVVGALFCNLAQSFPYRLLFLCLHHM